jgi:ElaB/YqjD/DUF883 family membrane-anchored ribosome-binding protein
MKNRISDYLPAPRHWGQSSKAAIPESRQLSHYQNAHQTYDIESYVTEHPLVAIGAAFSIGVFLAWLIKRI